MNKCTEQRFISDIAAHQINILRDDGVYRHITFKAPGTVIMHFDLITWPGSLCFTGDMGSYLFQRVEDMFRFFRADLAWHKLDDGLLINPGYWSEKLEAVDCNGCKEYSPDKFRQVVAEYLDSGNASDAIRADVEEKVLWHADDGEYVARQAVEDFNSSESEFGFFDFWETNLQEYTYNFIWCCYALVWGIAEYDKLKTGDVNL